LEKNKIVIRIYVINVEEIMGLQVVTSGAHIIGEVKGAKVDTSTWAIKFLTVKLTGEAAESLGMKKRFRSSKICIPVNMIQAVAHVVTIARSIEELESSQEITECKD
jgi:sporulation protein YlmC with PRC-barrel domain